MTFTNKSYDTWKWIALIVLPALSTFWLTFATIWSLPYGTEIAGTITAFNTLLGAMLGVSTKNYTPPTDGTMYVQKDGTTYAEFDKTPESLAESGGTIKMNVESI